jgi:hypothetical protein
LGILCWLSHSCDYDGCGYCSLCTRHSQVSYAEAPGQCLGEVCTSKSLSIFYLLSHSLCDSSLCFSLPLSLSLFLSIDYI